ncbi:hypothetical protein M8C21_016121 [Ambrosia artemisiifolia]|uniref:Tafazzin family protein n=1 Tax=Ambrosia artemisiifolia TaxID=4212 RepID=A0AAD5BUS7_AMBAR|nr:hypothetical protein M8C21_016121 [Ambrosia artemisiifolia]
MVRKMEWAGKANHLLGLPRKTVITAVGSFAKAVALLLNSTTVHNADTLLNLVRSRPPGVPLITVSNHMSTLDDPVMWGFKGFPTCNAELQRWVLAAEDICFKNTLHTFPQGKVYQEDEPIRRLKWGTASLIARAPVTPIVLPIIHHGFEKVMPEKYMFGRRPLVPLWNKDIKIIVGEPIEFDIAKLKQTAISISRSSSSFSKEGWPPFGPLDEAAQRCLYIDISERIRSVMEKMRVISKKPKA